MMGMFLKKAVFQVLARPVCPNVANSSSISTLDTGVKPDEDGHSL
jgi:hypothetical protein